MKFTEDTKSDSHAHPDVKKNIHYFLEKYKNITWLQDTKASPVIEKEDEWMCLIIVWGRGPKRMDKDKNDPIPELPRREGSFCISFHQPYDAFMKEFDLALNNLEIRHLIKRKSITYYQMKYGE